MSKHLSSAAILSRHVIQPGPMPTLDPFLFCVYHKDLYPAGNTANMEAPRRGNGQDFDPKAPYRMYHGSSIPGFPQHPHRGFETITATMAGLIDHADSVGNAGRYGQGDVQWMTAGKGVVHSEMFPLVHADQDNTLKLFQIWLNLPAKNKMAEPGFAMFWNHQVPVWESEDKKAKVTVWAGSYFGVSANNAPPPHSWAADPENDVAVIYMVLQPGGKLTLPKAHKGAAVNRSLYYVEGPETMQLDGSPIGSKVILDVKADAELELTLDEAATSAGEILLLQGKPINEPVAQYGPFVMNTQSEIQAAFADYRSTQFGGWPWPKDEMVFPREQERFAKIDGKESAPDVCVDK